MEFTWALPKQEMTLEELPAIHAKARLMTGADAKKIAETLFGDAAFFELTPDRQLSRQELQRKIAVMEQYPSQEALDRLWGSDDKDAYIQIHRESLAAYRSLLETAPEESNLQPCGWTLKEEPNQYGQWLRAIATVDGIDYSLTLNVAQYEEGRWINSLVIAPGDADPISYTPAMHARSQLCTTREPTQEDYAACLTKAQNLLDAMGMGDYRVLTDKTYVDPAYFAQDGQYEIYVMAAPAAEGYPVLFDQSGSECYGAARAHFSFNADGELIVFNLSNPVEMGEVVTRWQGRDLEGLLERGKQWLMCLTPEDLDRHGNLLMKRLGGDFAVTASVTITGLEQGLVPTDWYGKEQSILYTPGLLFRGTVEYYDKATNAYLTGSGDPYGPREQVLMTMDTIWDDVY